MLGWTNFDRCWVMGQFIAAGVNRGCVQRTDQWAYRIPFAIQWIWPVPIIIGVLFAPESPWWHVRRGDRAAARASLLRLTSPDKDPDFNPGMATLKGGFERPCVNYPSQMRPLP